ncbi:MAG: hypothetical protein KC468_24185, partial [Myxococcales bacterium]|nr:hypothetical protein [Myxococcales bacterium]
RIKLAALDALTLGELTRAEELAAAALAGADSSGRATWFQDLLSDLWLYGGLARLERGDYAGARASLERALEGLGAARERNVSMIYELQLARAYVAYAQAQLEEL